MKKYFSVLSLFIIPIVIYAADITTALNIEDDGEWYKGSGYGIAVESYDQYYPCRCKVDGNDAIFTIYHTSDFSVKEEFTLRNILVKHDAASSDWVINRGVECDIFYRHENGGTVYLTKNVFNDDDNWEVLLYSYSDETGYNYKVMNDKGEVVTTFLYSDTGLWAKSGAMEYMFLPENNYMMVRMHDKNVKIISFKGNGAGVKHVTALSGLNVYPNPLRRGESLTVRLQEQAEENAMLVITDMEGRTVCRQKIDAGANSATVEAGILFPGKYIYTLISPDKQPLSGKLIVE